MRKAIADFYFNCLKVELFDGEICYGETACMEGKGLLVKIAKDPMPDIDAVCYGVNGRNACPLVKTKQPKCPAHLETLVDKLETIAGRLRLGLTTPSSDFTLLELAAADGKAEAMTRIDKLRDIDTRHDAAVRKSLDANKQH